jgi:glucans biosynthesis protein C
MARTGQRIYHLDALRCFCMLFGLLLHGATIGNNALFDAVKETSDHFRMATFFLVSGYFTAMVASRTEVGAFLKNRGRLVLVPLVAGVLLLNPITNWLIQLYHGGGESLADYMGGGWRLPLPGPVVWHLHLWFLIALFVYAAVTPLLLTLAGSGPVTAMVDRLERLGPVLNLLLLTLCVGLCVVALRGVADQLLIPALPESAAFLVQATSNYFAYFAAGLFAFRHARLFEAMHRLFWVGLLLFGVACWLHPMVADDMPRGLERATYWLSRSGFIFLIVCGLLAIARRLVTKGSPMLSRLTDGVYSFYIFHFLVIYIIANLMRPWTDNLYLTYAVILVVGYPALFLIHERLIAPSPLLTLLFNGKTAARQVKPA